MDRRGFLGLGAAIAAGVGELALADTKKTPAKIWKRYMDQKSVNTYRKLGYTHVATVPSSSRDEEDGYKVVKKHETSGKFVDENGKEYEDADELPDAEEPKAKGKKS